MEKTTYRFIPIAEKQLVKLLQDCAIHFGVTNIPPDDGTTLDRINKYVQSVLPVPSEEREPYGVKLILGWLTKHEKNPEVNFSDLRGFIKFKKLDEPVYFAPVGSKEMEQPTKDEFLEWLEQKIEWKTTLSKCMVYNSVVKIKNDESIKTIGIILKEYKRLNTKD